MEIWDRVLWWESWVVEYQRGRCPLKTVEMTARDIEDEANGKFLLPEDVWATGTPNAGLEGEGKMAKENYFSYLQIAGNLIKGDLAEISDQLKKGNEAKRGVLWQVLTNLVCYANNDVFKEGYTKKLARQFKADLMSETGLSEKQAGKYTESISAALGVRQVRKGMKAIDGLPAAAADGPKLVEEFLIARQIDTFNSFLKSVKTEDTPVQRAAKMLVKLTPKQRDLARQMADKQDEDLEESED